jgi:uncharacterized protein involved in propanediol utilization
VSGETGEWASGATTVHSLREPPVAIGFHRRHPAELRAGTGYAPAHHGELLQGVFEDATGQLRRALVTLPQPHRGTRATFHPSYGYYSITVENPALTKARRAGVLALHRFWAHPDTVPGGRIEIISDVPTKIGMGSSTSDVTAAIRAIADYHGVSLPKEEVGRLAVLAEGASDSTMIDDRVVLFAQRDGLVLETFGYRLPAMVVVGCDTEPGAGVDTLRLKPAEYNDQEIGAFQVLRAALRRAIATDDVALLGRVATASARINERFLPKPNFVLLLDLGLRNGACGIQVAHSGTVAGLILDPRRPGIDEAIERCVSGIEELGLAMITVFGIKTDATPVRVTA